MYCPGVISFGFGCLKTLASLGAAYDFVLVDGVANQEEMVAAAVKISDAVLIPVLIAVELIAFLASGFAPAREGRGRRQNRRRASSRVSGA